MQKTVIDSGPLIALFDRDDKFHKKVLEFLKNFRGELMTTWPVITEVSHLLDFNLAVQIDFLTWIERGAVTLYDIPTEELGSIIETMERYTNVPMDLADATLTYVTYKEGIGTIVSIDSDFDIYRTLKKGALVNLLRL